MSDHDDESSDRCPLSKPTARVEDDEDIGLLVYHDLLCDENGRPTEGAFQFNVLLLRSNNTEQFPHNKCGESEGVSVERDIAARKRELIECCKQLSSEKSKKAQNAQTPKGFSVAKVKALRQMRFEADQSVKRGKHTDTIISSEQIVFVLADGRPDRPNHCVMRLHKKIDRTLWKKILEKLFVAFRPGADCGADVGGD